MEYSFTKEEIRRIRTICGMLNKPSLEVRAYIQNEILMLTPILVFNETIKSLNKVDSVSTNGECIQLNLEVGNGGL